MIEGRIFFNLCMFQVNFLPFIKSWSSHVPSTVGPGKEGLTSTLGSCNIGFKKVVLSVRKHMVMPKDVIFHRYLKYGQ